MAFELLVQSSKVLPINAGVQQGSVWVCPIKMVEMARLSYRCAAAVEDENTVIVSTRSDLKKLTRNK